MLRRLPCKESFWQVLIFFVDRQIKTVPTGLFAVAPPGPAIPVILIPKSAFDFLRMFSAIDIATWRETAPYLEISLGGIFNILSFDLLL